MTIKQAHVVALDPLPDRVAQLPRLKLVLQPVERFLNPQAVKIDTLALQLSDAIKVSGFEALLREPRRVPKEAVMAVESIEDGGRDFETSTPHECVSANNSRPISMRRISLVPAPISYSLASRHRRPQGPSLT